MAFITPAVGANLALSTSKSTTKPFSHSSAKSMVSASRCRVIMMSHEWKMPRSPREIVDEAISKDKVVVFSKTSCPYCKAVKELFETMKVDYKVYELNKLENGGALQMALLEKTGQRTVPNVFISTRHVGGCDDTMAALERGDLEKWLKA
eukprot:CAMPEP_0184691526 /NCGR_PEP_ID=MMETSP0313-20130426/355_1 /TAXON_ID=2792 /ORGANISM="Porphyridium aerugineum, Strain SAG 1380-2" /LENGTH=149 /DNA_ID=CAMNT_0027149261 /DNA_START=8 /DNA_END=457 /DNA_ORIENTATION=+